MDERVRRLEQAAARDGDVESQAALLRARVRAGECSVESVTVAALLGHPPALLLDEARAPAPAAALGKFTPRIAHGVQKQRRATYCGRNAVAIWLEGVGVPECLMCASSESWRRDVQRSLISMVGAINAIDPQAAFRCCFAMVEEVFPLAEQESSSDRQRLWDLARWASTGNAKRLPSAFGLAGPTFLYDGGLDVWLYDLTEAAWAIQRHGKLTSRQIERATDNTARWVTGVREGLERLTAMRTIMRERVVPWLLDGEDPLAVLADFLALDSRIATD